MQHACEATARSSRKRIVKVVLKANASESVDAVLPRLEACGASVALEVSTELQDKRGQRKANAVQRLRGALKFCFMDLSVNIYLRSGFPGRAPRQADVLSSGQLTVAALTLGTSKSGLCYCETKGLKIDMLFSRSKTHSDSGFKRVVEQKKQHQKFTKYARG